MTRVKTTAEVEVYEVNGKEQLSNPPLTVRTHWNNEHKINVKIGDIEVVVLAVDLELAIKRCSR